MFSSFMSIRVSTLLDPVLPPSFQSRFTPGCCSAPR